MPASSTPGMRTARQPRYSSRSASSSTRPRNAASGGARARSRASSGPVPDDPERPARAAVGVEHELEALVGGEGGDDEVVGSGPVGARGEEGGVDRRRDHDRVAPVVAADAPGDVGAVRGEAVDAGRGSQRPRRAAAPRWGGSRGGRGARRGRGRSSRRSGPTRTASGCGSSRGAAPRAPGALPWPRSGSWRARGRSRRGRTTPPRRGRAAGSGGSASPPRAAAARRRCGSPAPRARARPSPARGAG